MKYKKKVEHIEANEKDKFETQQIIAVYIQLHRLGVHVLGFFLNQRDKLNKNIFIFFSS